MAEAFKPPEELNLKLGNVDENWNKWSQKFLIYMEATEKIMKPEKQKVAIFLNLIGDDALDVYNTLQFTDEAEKNNLEYVMKKFKDYCEPKKNVTYERYKFFTRTQKEGENVDVYLTELKKLATQCEFKEQTEGLIKDMLILGLNDKNLQGKLLRTSDLELQKAINFCRVQEVSARQMKDLNKSTVDTVDKSCRPKKDNLGNKYQKTQKEMPPNFKKKCQRCGLSHKARSCPAWGKKCNKCKRMNHFAKQCRTMSAISEKAGITDADETLLLSVTKSKETGSINSVEWKEVVTVEGVEISFKLDTGAEVNIIPYEIYKSFKKTPVLKPTSKRLTSYSGHVIDVTGSCLLHCTTKQHHDKLVFYIVKGNCQPILGLVALQKLHLVERVHVMNTPVKSSEENETPSDDANKIIEEFSDVFEGQGKIKGIEYNIRLKPEAVPEISSCRRLPLALMEEVKNEIDRMVKIGTLQKVEEPTEWVHPIVVVRKPNGSVRICLDPRPLNKYILREQYLMPTFDIISAQLAGSQFFTVLDASTAYWQIALSPESSNLCTIATPFGRYKFLRLPYGLNSAPEVFQRTMNNIIEGLEGTAAYMDDCIIYGKDMKEHNQRLAKVLQRFREYNLKLSRDKIQLAKTQVTFMGQTVQKEGIAPTEKRIKAILDISPPENKSELKSFLGTTNYLSRFIPNYSERTKVLRSLLKDKAEWIWEQNEQQCFDSLKMELTRAPVLAFFDENKDTVLAADASQAGLGAVLLQEMKPVAYVSVALTECQKRYSQIEKELLAIVMGCEKFHYYLYGREFIVETDHKPLINIVKKSIEDLSPRLQRLMIRLMRYSATLKYVPGKQMYIPDMLSRSRNTKETVDTGYLEDKAATVHSLVCTTEEKIKEIITETMKDPQLQKLVSICKKGWPTHKSRLDSDVKEYWNIKEEIHESDDLVFRGQAIIIPRTMRKQVLQKIHIVHQGINTCIRRAKDAVYWPGIRKDIQHLVENCEMCQKYARSNQNEPMIPHNVPCLPWEKVGIDFAKIKENTYVLVTDYHSKFVEARQVLRTNADTLIKVLKAIFRTHGIPLEIISDNGPPFDSVAFREFCKEYDCKSTTSSPNYPKSNGMVERAIQTVKTLMLKLGNKGEDPEKALLEYNATPKENLPSPAELLMGRRLRTFLPMTTVMRTPKFETSDTVKLLLENQRKQKCYADRSTKTLPPLTVGQNVRVQGHDKRWSLGKIVQVGPQPRSYLVKTEMGKVLRRNRFHLRQVP